MDVFSRLLKYYQINNEDLLNRKINDDFSRIEDPFFKISDFNKLIDLLKDAKDKQIKTVIYGDYDVDGMTSTSIMYLSLKKLGLTAGFYIPSRFKDGYGITKEMIDVFYKKDYKLIILVDNGISKFEEVSYAYSLGMKVIIIDHHEIIDNKVPQCEYVLHQFYSNYSSYNVSAAFLCMLVNYGLFNRFDEYICLLAGIAVLSDSIELTPNNTFLVSHALKLLNEFKYPNFNLLLIGQIKKPNLINDRYYDKNNILINYPIYSHDISFKINSYLNSLGRVDIKLKNNNGVYFLISNNLNDIQKYYEFIMNTNNLKKEIIKEIKTKIDDKKDSDLLDIKYIETDQIGVIGSVCAEYAIKNKRSALLFTNDPVNNEFLVGSARSYLDFPIYNLALKYSDFYEKFGGHLYAFGITIKKSEFSKIKSLLLNNLNSIDYQVKKQRCVLLDLEDLSSVLYNIYMKFDPFGNTFDDCMFAIKIKKNLFRYSNDGKHLLFRKDNFNVNYFNFDMDYVTNHEDFYFVGHLSKKVFRNEYSYSLNIEKHLENFSDYELIY